MTNKFGKKNLIQFAICIALIIAFALPTGLMLKKNALGPGYTVNNNENGTVENLNSEDETVASDVSVVLNDATADESAVDEILVSDKQLSAAEADELISVVDDGVFRGTGEGTSESTVTIEKNNMAEAVVLTGSLEMVGNESEANSSTTDLTQNDVNDVVTNDNLTDNAEIFLLSFDDETIVKRIDGVEDEVKQAEESVSGSSDKLTLSGISQSKDVAKKSKDLVCKYNPAMDITLSDEEYEILCRIVEAEAGDQDIYGRILVANVILNRTQYWEFPDTVKGVVFQVNSKGAVQFSPVANGRFYSVKISKKTKKAVNSALSGDDYSDGALYFFMRSATSASKSAWFDSLEFIMKYGCHEFFK